VEYLRIEITYFNGGNHDMRIKALHAAKAMAGHSIENAVKAPVEGLASSGNEKLLLWS
jgi:hypothetical protein